MGVYIKNKEMPESCYECAYSVEKDGICSITEGGCDWGHSRPPHCPLEEIDLVRCGECKWWDKDGESPYGYCHAEKHCHFSSNWEISIYRKYKADHYCSDGERRE